MGETKEKRDPALSSSACGDGPPIMRVTDYQDRGAAGVQPREVFINTHYLVAMEPWGSKYKVFVGRSLEYVVSAEDAQRLSATGCAVPEP